MTTLARSVSKKFGRVLSGSFRGKSTSSQADAAPVWDPVLHPADGHDLFKLEEPVVEEEPVMEEEPVVEEEIVVVVDEPEEEEEQDENVEDGDWSYKTTTNVKRCMVLSTMPCPLGVDGCKVATKWNGGVDHDDEAQHVAGKHKRHHPTVVKEAPHKVTREERLEKEEAFINGLGQKRKDRAKAMADHKALMAEDASDSDEEAEGADDEEVEETRILETHVLNETRTLSKWDGCYVGAGAYLLKDGRTGKSILALKPGQVFDVCQRITVKNDLKVTTHVGRLSADGKSWATSGGGDQIYLKLSDGSGYATMFNYNGGDLMAIDIDPLRYLSPEQIKRAQAATVTKALDRMEEEVREKLHGAAVPNVRVEMVQRKLLTCNDIHFKDTELFDGSKNLVHQVAEICTAIHDVCEKWGVDFPMIEMQVHAFKKLGVDDESIPRALTDGRAASMMSFLSANGVKPEWVKVISFGDSMPIPDHPHVYSVANQRVEFSLGTTQTDPFGMHVDVDELLAATDGTLSDRFKLFFKTTWDEATDPDACMVFSGPDACTKLRISEEELQVEVLKAKGLKKMFRFSDHTNVDVTFVCSLISMGFPKPDIYVVQKSVARRLPVSWNRQCMDALDEITKAKLFMNITNIGMDTKMFEMDVEEVPEGATVVNYADKYGDHVVHEVADPDEEALGHHDMIEYPLCRTSYQVAKFLVLRRQPHANSKPTGYRLPPGVVFKVSQKVVCARDNAEDVPEVWFKALDGSGWVCQYNARTGVELVEEVIGDNALNERDVDNAMADYSADGMVVRKHDADLFHEVYMVWNAEEAMATAKSARDHAYGEKFYAEPPEGAEPLVLALTDSEIMAAEIERRAKDEADAELIALALEEEKLRNSIVAENDDDPYLTEDERFAKGEARRLALAFGPPEEITPEEDAKRMAARKEFVERRLAIAKAARKKKMATLQANAIAERDAAKDNDEDNAPNMGNPVVEGEVEEGEWWYLVTSSFNHMHTANTYKKGVGAMMVRCAHSQKATATGLMLYEGERMKVDRRVTVKRDRADTGNQVYVRLCTDDGISAATGDGRYIQTDLFRKQLDDAISAGSNYDSYVGQCDGRPRWTKIIAQNLSKVTDKTERVKTLTEGEQWFAILSDQDGFICAAESSPPPPAPAGGGGGDADPFFSCGIGAAICCSCGGTYGGPEDADAAFCAIPKVPHAGHGHAPTCLCCAPEPAEGFMWPGSVELGSGVEEGGGPYDGYGSVEEEFEYDGYGSVEED